MSVRIHEIAKETGLTSKEILALLKERGFQVKTASSSIDPISAESIIGELNKNKAPAESAPEEKIAEPVKETPKPVPTAPPMASFVKSKKEIEEAKEAKRLAEEEKRKGKPVTPPAPPVAPPVARNVPPAAPPPIPGAGAAPKTPPVVSSAPPPLAPPRTVPPVVAPPVVTSPVVAPPRTVPPVVAPPVVTPPVVASPRTTPPVVAPPVLSAPSPVAPPLVAPGVSTPPIPPALDDAQAASSDTETSEEGVTVTDDGIKVITVKPPIVVKEFATEIDIKPFRLISELMEINIFASMNTVIDEDVASKIAEKHGFLLEVKHRGEEKAPVEKKAPVEVDDSKFLESRPPVVCILGHVDHGKTTLLDSIRKANVVGGEHGGITQHIGAYQVSHSDRKITFLDTPGHAAFSKMRERGVGVTDIAILIVAADDGFMPQTDEALKFAQKSGDPIIVAINKTDSKGADIPRVMGQMQERNLAPEALGGDTIAVPVSALKGEGIEELLEMINLQTEVMELKANPQGPASGMIIESQIEVGRGSTATVIVQKGTLKIGAGIVCGTEYARVKAMVDENGKPVKSAPPSTPVSVAGWSGPPASGATFQVVKNEKEAKRLAADARHAARGSVVSTSVEAEPELEEGEEAVAADPMQKLLDAIAQTKKKVLKIVLKTDVHGSGEAIVDMLNTIESTKVDIKVVSSTVGIISKNDVDLASSGSAMIIGFNVKTDNGVMARAKHEGVRLLQFSIIYQMIDDVKEAMSDMLEPELIEKRIGSAEIRQIFPVSRGVIAGCLITDGRVVRDGKVHILRNGKQVGTSKISMLKRFKDDVTEVRTGYECGIQIRGINDYKEGDTIECFEIEKRRASL